MDNKIKEIRTLFHDVNDKLNHVSIPLSYYAASHKDDLDSMSQDELRSTLREVLQELKKLENVILDCGKISKTLKGKVYEAMKIDNTRPLK